MYPEQLLQGTGITQSSVSVDSEWNFNATVYSFSVTTRGKPHMSTWKRDLEVCNPPYFFTLVVNVGSNVLGRPNRVEDAC